MRRPLRVAASACFFLIICLPEKTLSNPYGYYGAYSRTRRDPTAWNPAYDGMSQPNPVPVVPNALGPHSMPSYGGHLDNQGVGMGGSYRQDANMYGRSQYGNVANGYGNPVLGRVDTQQHRSPTHHAAGGVSSSTDLDAYQSQSHFPSRLGAERGASNSAAPDGCEGVRCEDLTNCINVTVNDTKCCPQCVTFGCICQGYQVYDCQKNGFEDGMVPERKAYTVAGGTTVCSCPPGGGSITCSFHDPESSKCPDLPPNCVKPFVREIDGCDDCAMFGCTAEDGTLVEEGMAKEKPPCTTCLCPAGGGKLICGVDKVCEAKLSQQGTGSLAMESSIRELSSFGESNEANAYPGYNGLEGYPDYQSPYGQNTGIAPVVPPVSQIGTAADGSVSDGGTKGRGADGSQGLADSKGYSSFGSYRQGYGTGYQDLYAQYSAYGRGNLASYGSLQGYGTYGYNHPFAHEGTGYSQQGNQKHQSQTSISSGNAREKAQGGAALLQNEDSRGQRVDGYNSYGRQPYVPPLLNSGFQSPGSQDASDATSTAIESKTDKVEIPALSQSGIQRPGYPYDSYSRARYYDPRYYEQYQDYGQYPPQFPTADSADSASALKPMEGSEKSLKQPVVAESDSGGQQNPARAKEQQAYAGSMDQYPYGTYDGYRSYYGYQFAYPHGEMPAGAGGDQNGQDAGNHPSMDPNALPHDSNTPSQHPAGRPQDATSQQGSSQNYEENVQPHNYPYYPYDQQQMYPAYPTQKGTQDEPVNPPIMQPDEMPKSLGHALEDDDDDANPEVTGRDTRPSPTEGSWSRRIRDNLNVINKDSRFTHDRASLTSTTPSTTTTTTPEPTTTTTTTTVPTTTTSTTTTATTRPTTTTTTTTTRPTTTTTTTTSTTTTTTAAPTTTTISSRRKKTQQHEKKKMGLERVLSGCCSKGRRWAMQYNSCDGITVMSGTYSHMCSVAQEKCCIEERYQQNCQSGKNLARSAGACEVPANLENTCGASEFKTCCDCCEMGIKAIGLGLGCDIDIFGDQCNKAYSDCCNSVSAGGSQKSGTVPTTELLETSSTSPQTPEPIVPRCATHGRCQQVCDDTSEGMVCSCRRGYRIQANRRDCVDVNECVLNTHTCTEHQICLNREGSFFCKRKISCGTGYELTESNQCEDIDECALSIDDCLPNTDCENIRGSYRCIPKLCDKGFITDATGRCIDIDECRTRRYSCPRGASCVNTEGSYDCRCPVGLSPNEDNTLCEDIDECATGTANCKMGATCINTVGSFACQDPPKLRCSPGYEPDEETRTCKDIDECSRNTHTCNSGSTCINEHGGFRCQDPLVCPDGMRPDEEGNVCLDINECEDPSLHRCDVGGTCVNFLRTFKCVCDSGYRNAVTEEGLPTCQDVDECSTEEGSACFHKCTNLPGSYQCSCPNGYEVQNSGEICQDIDECASTESICPGDETCFNTHGTYKCVDLSCPVGYTRISNTRKTRRCTRQSCRGKPRSCLRLAKQISFHNISLTNGTIREKPLFRMSLARTNVNDRYEFVITDGNADKSFKVKSSTRISRPTGVVYTAKELTGPAEHVIDLTLKLNRGRRHSTYVSRLYVFVGKYNM